MGRADSLYPNSPRNVPDDLTTPSRHYQLRVLLVLTSLMLFFILYLGLIAGSAYLIFRSIFWPVPINLVLMAFFGLFFLFLIKGFFKRQEAQKSLMVELTEEEHPRLFAFIDKLCEETNAPFPHRIFVNPDVNAGVFYDTESILSLLVPTPKNLLIGLGLVNVLNLSEFKAVMAHEFGHFSQNSTKLKRYVYRAFHIIGDMVNGRDWLDKLILGMRNSRSRLAVIGWGCWIILWLFRQVLKLCYHSIDFLVLSLSRQMEFNADLVAVSVTGSDAIVHGLSRLNFANDALLQAKQELTVAADHQLYTSDLFHHQNHAASYLRRIRKDPQLGEPPPLPDDPRLAIDIFEPGDDGIPPMWSTHPSNYDREQNAKRHYIRCPIDERSPWLLFDNPQALRESVTWRFYRIEVRVKRDVVLADPQGVQVFINDEHAETTYDARYHGLYDGRLLQPGDLGELTRTARTRPWKANIMAGVHARLYGGDFKARMKEYALLREEYTLLSGLNNGELTLKGDTFTFRGRRYSPGAAKRLLKKVNAELDEELEWMHDLDRKAFLVHYQMGLELGQKVAKELLARYEFHLAVQKIIRNLMVQQDALRWAMGMISGKNQPIAPGEFDNILRIFREAHDVLSKTLRTADRLLLPELKNITAGEPLGYFLMEKQLVAEFSRHARTLTFKKIAKFLQQMGEIHERARRIHFKSLGAILALQEKIGQQWKTELAGVPEVMAAEEEESPNTAVVGKAEEDVLLAEEISTSPVEAPKPARPKVRPSEPAPRLPSAKKK